MHVLLVESDKNMSRVLADMLRWMGHEVTQREELDDLGLQDGGPSREYGMVIAHHHPPVLDALNAEKLIHAVMPGVPLVVMMDPKDEVQILQLGMSGVSAVVQRPVSVGAMRRVVEGVGENP
jgi:DNA-binding NtrC family response regulator